MSTCPITNEVTLPLIEMVSAKSVHGNIKHLVNASRSVSISTYKKILSSQCPLIPILVSPILHLYLSSLTVKTSFPLST